MTLAARLAAGLDELGIGVAAGVQEKLLSYVALIAKWNRVYNLTAIRDAAQMISHHVLDSLAVVPYLEGSAIADVGSGAGLPGIPIALAQPQWHVSLIESNHKKGAFLRQAAIELELNNVEIREERVEQIQLRETHDSVISRAFADVASFTAAALPLCRRGGLIAAMKGVYPYEELAQLAAGSPVRLERVIPLNVPGLRAQRHLVLMRRD